MNKFNEVLKINQERTQARKIEEKRKQKIRKNKEIILTVFIALAILTMMSKILLDMQEKAIDNCVNNGYTENFCIENL